MIGDLDVKNELFWEEWINTEKNVYQKKSCFYYVTVNKYNKIKFLFFYYCMLSIAYGIHSPSKKTWRKRTV